MGDRKLIGEWKGIVTMYGTLKERKIQIFKVKNQKNKIVFSGFRGLEEGTLLAIKRKKPTLLGGHMGINGNLEFVSVTYSARGSHQGGPMHAYNKHVAFASKDEKILESLMKFLQKHITKGKVRRTKTIKRGGGKRGDGKRGDMNIRVKPDEFKKMISEMEQSAMEENKRCNVPCHKIKTNFSKDKKKKSLKLKCHQGCEKKRMKTVREFHKEYPTEFKVFVNQLLK